MKIFITKLIFLTTFVMTAQMKEGANLLLLKMHKTRDLKIDKEVTKYLVLELDLNFNLLKDQQLTSLVYFKDFTDQHYSSCVKKDSIPLMKLRKNDTFEHDNNYGLKNAEIIENNSEKMNHLLKLVVKSALYNQKITVTYTVINCNYCIGDITKYDKEFIGHKNKVVLLSDNLIINNSIKIPKEKIYDIIKSIDFNNHLF